jgi:hypothetical protein
MGFVTSCRPHFRLADVEGLKSGVSIMGLKERSKGRSMEGQARTDQEELRDLMGECLITLGRPYHPLVTRSFHNVNFRTENFLLGYWYMF